MKKILFILFLIIIVLFGYTSSLIGVDESTKAVYSSLKKGLVKQGHNANLIAISGKRWKLDNWFFCKLSGASPSSQHLNGLAIDFIVLDINNDNKINEQDVDIVYQLLNKTLIGKQGGIGTYKNEKGFFNRQMIHFDLRGSKARWNR